VSNRARINGALLEEGRDGLVELEAAGCSTASSCEDRADAKLCCDTAVSGTVENRVPVPSSSSVTSLNSDSATDSLGVPLGGRWFGEDVARGDSNESSAKFLVPEWEGCELES
jgi:hypothetical protein